MNSLLKNIILTPFNLLYNISPEYELKLMFRLKQGYSLNLEDPQTFNEKIQWIKLYDKNPLMAKCSDKYLVRNYIKELGCGELLTRLLWEGAEPETIPFDSLPSRFVIKATHGSTFNIICEDKSKLNQANVIEKCRKWLNARFLPCYGEWFYGVERPRIIIEEFLESDDKTPVKDYKVLCFNGNASLIRVDSDRFTRHKTDLYDLNWNLLKNVRWKYPNSDEETPKPECLNKLLQYAEKIAKPFHLARVDFYIARSKIYFGEITFTSCAGFDRF